jgi:hypothetical protein
LWPDSFRVDSRSGQLAAAAAGAELVEPALELSDDVELDFSDDEELLDSELPLEPLELEELLVELLAASRLSVR